MDEPYYSNPVLEHYECDGQISIFDILDIEEPKPDNTKITEGAE